MNWQAYISNQTDISSILEFDEQPNTYSLIDGAYIYIYIYLCIYLYHDYSSCHVSTNTVCISVNIQ